MTTERKLKGQLAEAKVLSYFVENGYEVFIPFTANPAVDLLVIKNNVVSKISVKYTACASSAVAWSVTLCTVSRRNNGLTHKKIFSPIESDYVAVYIAPEDRVVLLTSANIQSKTMVSIKKLEV